MATANLNPSADTFITSQFGNQDNSASTTLRVRNNADANTNQTLMLFDLSSIPAGSTINSAQLNLQVGTVIAEVSVSRVLTSWNDTDTWNDWSSGVAFDDAEASSTPAVSGSTALASTGAQSITGLASLVQAMLDGTNNGFVLHRESTQSQQLAVDSAEGTTPPVLAIDYSPPSNSTGLLLRGVG